MPRAAKYEGLPSEYTCNICEKTKPLVEMCLVRSNGMYRLRPRCKKCHNKRELGHRRDYKRKYLQRWRKQNAAVNESYWRGNKQVREHARIRAATRSREENDAIAIQRRLRTKGESVTIAEARELLAQYGRCYPTRFGLTKKGLAMCERIRSRLRNRTEKHRMLSSFEIRLMVYEESAEEIGLVIPPEQQPIPYQKAAERLRQYHRTLRVLGATA